jgi:IS30 family transposase
MYNQLTQEERYQIKAYKESGLTQSKIAQKLGRAKSTISREGSVAKK